MTDELLRKTMDETSIIDELRKGINNMTEQGLALK
jgi:hypothetical protein